MVVSRKESHMLEGYFKALTNQLRDIRKRVQRGSLDKLSPEALALVKEAREILENIITDDMEM